MIRSLNYRRAACFGCLACLVGLLPASRLVAETAELRILAPGHVVWSAAVPAAGEKPQPAPAKSSVSQTSYVGDAPPAAAPAPAGRTSLEMIAPQAQAHITYALNLAERGAVHSAKAEFTTALDLIADALDADMHDATRSHARAVKAGLKAIEETKDFVPADSANDIGLDVVQIAAAHQTPVLKSAASQHISRAEALQRYHTFATEQLAYASGTSQIGSAALYGLGRSYTVTTAGAGVRNPLAGPNAMAMYQAALVVDPKNYMACNELGVLMARYGDLEAAENQFVHSLSIKPQPEAWHNLAAVYRAKGQAEKAMQAEQEQEKLIASTRAANAPSADGSDIGSRPMLDFVDPDTFAASGTPYGLDGPPINAPQQQSFGKRLVAKLIPWPKANKTEQAEETRVSQRTDASQGGGTDSRPLLR